MTRMKILVVKRDKLGDLLLTTPLVQKLRQHYPAARIDLLASEYNAWVANGNPHLTQILAYPKARIGSSNLLKSVWTQFRLFWTLRSQAYDVAIVAQGEDSPRAIKRTLWTGAKRVISYVELGHDYGPSLTDPLTLPGSDHEAQRLLDLLVPLGIHETLTDEPPYFVLPESANQFANEWISENGTKAGQYVVLGLGARRARKQPSTQQIVRWVQWLKAVHGLDTVFMWTPGPAKNAQYPGDDEIADPVLKANPKGLKPFRGPLLPALGLIWQARTSIFPDSGLMHFASASPGGVLGLFGDEPTFAAKWAPLGARSSYLRADRVTDLDDNTVYGALEKHLACEHR